MVPFSARRYHFFSILGILTLFLSSCGGVGGLADRLLFGVTEPVEVNRGPLGATVWPDRDGDDAFNEGTECNYTVREKGGSQVFKIMLNRQPTADVTIPVTISPDGYASTDKPEVVFTSANWDQPQTITITTLVSTDVDVTVGGLSLIALKFEPAKSQDSDYNLFSVPQVNGIVVIDGDESAVIATTNINARSDKKLETSEDAKKGCVSVVLSKAPTGNVTVPVSSSDTTEGTVSSASLTFTTGNWSTSQPIIVTGVDDALIDGDVGYNIVLGNATSADGSYSNKTPSTNQHGGGETNDIAAINLDNDVPDVQVSAVTRTINEGAVVGAANEFTVKLLKGPAQIVTIPVSVNSMPKTYGVDRATLNTNLLTFTSGECSDDGNDGNDTGNWCKPQKVIITPNNNNVVDGDVNFKVILGEATNYGGVNPPDVDVTIIDDDEPKILVTDPTPDAVEHTGQKSTFELVLNTKPSDDVTIEINSVYSPSGWSGAVKPVDRLGGVKLQDRPDTPANTTTVTFTQTDWNVPKKVDFVPENDDIADGNIQFLIEVKPATSNDPDYNGRKATKGGSDVDGVTINYKDNDEIGFSIKAKNKNDCAENSYTTGKNSVTFTGFATDDNSQLDTSCFSQWTMALRSKPLGNVTVSLELVSNHNDGTLNTSTLIFTPSNYANPLTVTVTGDSNGSNEGNHDYTVRVSSITGDGMYANKTYGYNDSSKVARPSFSIFSCDNDGANSVVSCRRSGSFATSENGGKAILWWIGQSSAACTVTAASSDESEGKVTYAAGGMSGSPTAGTVNITTGNWNTMSNAGTNRIEITGQDDLIFDGNVLYHLNVTATTCASLDPSAQTVAIRNIDNEQALVVCDPGGGIKDSNESGTTGQFGLKMAGSNPSGNVSFTIGCQGGGSNTECSSVSPSTVTINTSNSCVPVTVTPKADNRADGDQDSCMTFGEMSTSDDYYNGITPPVLCPIKNKDKDKIIFITDGATPELNPKFDSMNTVDTNYCNHVDYGMPNWGSYKAFLVDNASRKATTTGTNTTGQQNWVLQPNTTYYRKDIGENKTGPYTTKLFTTNSYGLIPSFDASFTSNAGVTYWTGMNTDMTTATDTCQNWTANDNSNVSPYQTTYGQGDTTYKADALSKGISDCGLTTTRRLICVQQ